MKTGSPWLDDVMGDFFGYGKKEVTVRTKSYRTVSDSERNEVQVDVPRCGPEDVSVHLTGDVLEVAWVRSSEQETVRVRVPSHVLPEQVSASVQKGVLTVKLPRKPKMDWDVKPVRIPVT